MKDLHEIQKELYDMLMEMSEDQVSDGSSEAFALGVSSGFYDAAAMVSSYFIDLMEKQKEEKKPAKHEWKRLPNGNLELVRPYNGIDQWAEVKMINKTGDDEEMIRQIADSILFLMGKAREHMQELGENFEYIRRSGKLYIMDEPVQEADGKITVGLRYEAKNLNFTEETSDD